MSHPRIRKSDHESMSSARVRLARLAAALIPPLLAGSVTAGAGGAPPVAAAALTPSAEEPERIEEAKAYGQTSDGTATSGPAFRRGQKVYVIAYTIAANPDLTATVEVAKAFDKMKAFERTDKLEGADFVFVLFADYNTVRMPPVGENDEKVLTIDRDGIRYGPQREELMTAAAVVATTPDEFREHKTDLEALREGSLWTELVSTGRGLTIVDGRTKLPKKAVEKFHEAALGIK